MSNILLGSGSESFPWFCQSNYAQPRIFLTYSILLRDVSASISNHHQFHSNRIIQRFYLNTIYNGSVRRIKSAYRRKQIANKLIVKQLTTDVRVSCQSVCLQSISSWSVCSRSVCCGQLSWTWVRDNRVC